MKLPRFPFMETILTSTDTKLSSGRPVRKVWPPCGHVTTALRYGHWRRPSEVRWAWQMGNLGDVMTCKDMIRCIQYTYQMSSYGYANTFTFISCRGRVQVEWEREVYGYIAIFAPIPEVLERGQKGILGLYARVFVLNRLKICPLPWNINNGQALPEAILCGRGLLSTASISFQEEKMTHQSSSNMIHACWDIFRNGWSLKA